MEFKAEYINKLARPPAQPNPQPPPPNLGPSSGREAIAASNVVPVAASPLPIISSHAVVQNAIVHDAEELVQRILIVDELVVGVEEVAGPLVRLTGGPSSVLVAFLRTGGGVEGGLLVRLAHHVRAGADGTGAKILAGGVSWRRDDTILDITVGAGNDDLELLVGVACVDQVVQGHRAAPEDTLDVGHAVGVRAISAGGHAGVALKEYVETLAGLLVGAGGGTSCNVVGLQQGVAKVVICAVGACQSNGELCIVMLLTCWISSRC